MMVSSPNNQLLSRLTGVYPLKPGQGAGRERHVVFTMSMGAIGLADGRRVYPLAAETDVIGTRMPCLPICESNQRSTATDNTH